jgi:predicted NUDIX family phosphoesterase
MPFDPSEKVWCFSSSFLDTLPGGRFQGFRIHEKITPLLFGADGPKFVFLPRGECEKDPSYKQLITYSLIRYGDKCDHIYYSYTRGNSSGDDRLKSLLSLGIGGHINESAMDFRVPLRRLNPGANMKRYEYVLNEAQREIEEEVVHSSRKPVIHLSGYINDDSNDVGSVHFGVVFTLIISDLDVRPREDAIKDGGMIPRDIIKKEYARYESWSQILIDQVI